MSFKGDLMLDRLLNQFKQSPNLVNLLGVINRRFEDTDAILDYLLYNRFLDTAAGVWLDVIGIIVGVPNRPYTELPNPFTYTSVVGPQDPNLGYGEVGGTTGGHYTSLSGSPTTTLIGDEEYLEIIKAKIIATYSSPSIPSIYTFIKSAFGVESIVEVPSVNEVTVELLAPLEVYQRSLVYQIAPIKAGANITIINWP